MAQNIRMTLSLIEVPAEKLGDWVANTRAGFVASLVESGETQAAAEERADQSLSRVFPDGELADGHVVFDAVADGVTVGRVWIGLAFGDDPAAWWVWDIEIDAEFRGRGFGRTAMLLAEDEARSRGAQNLGLNVFGSNRIARGLYESLGYQTTSLQMRKRL